ncbi:hypothetical protein DI005_17980 [Prauserella sp. PE36]|uniref:alpha/beta hydrolase n=1 Tax=Prauserella sp. PE36 TaxID=1504709 RepID=UPI000DE4EF0F|nr:alpha/beta hydrolase-fold protein [Prauserella sp. PE36]RBM18907.1 hypothetical protein DI005_17980 [Prauserella sp. PE36]
MRRTRLTRGLVAVTASCALLAATCAGAQAAENSEEPLAAIQAGLSSLPRPYSEWDVTLTPKSDEPGALLLSYDSPALGLRSDNTIYLPARYRSSGVASPVLYFLHGTVVSPLDNPLLTPVTEQESLLGMVGAGGGNTQTKLQGFADQRDRADFVVVSPDTNSTDSWCETCLWIDGQRDVLPNLAPVTAETVPAETVLHQEVIPLVQEVLNVRTDRGGRGISGFSMGAVGALIQAFRHPDMFGYTAAISGPYDFVDDTFWRNWVDLVGYTRDQGYGLSLTGTFRWRNFNPADLVGNFAGSGSPLLISAGDVCAPPTDDAGAADCARYPAVRNPLASLIESQMRRNNDANIEAISNAGVQAKQVRYSGIHGAYNHRVYADVIVPDANNAFRTAPGTSEAFSYRTQDTEFGVWGYEVTTDRDRPAFLALEGARHDAAAFSVRGGGSVTVTTPGSFTPGERYRVRYSSTKGEVREDVVVADPGGRLRIGVDLDEAAYATAADALALFGKAPGFASVRTAPA